MRLVSWLVFWFVFVAPAYAEVPQSLHYNGYLTNAVGEPLDCPDAMQCAENYDLTFRLYSVAEGGSPVWDEVEPSVAIYQGSFHVTLGDGSPLDAQVLNGPLWLSVKVNNNAEMLPRQELASAAYAIRAGQVDFADNAGQLQGLEADDFATKQSMDELQEIVGASDDDTLAQLECLDGQVIKSSAGAWVCAVAGESDTTLTEPEVDDMVANNGFAMQADLAAAQTSIATLQELIAELSEKQEGDIAMINVELQTLLNAVNAIQGQLDALAAVATSGEYADLNGTPSDSDVLMSLGCAAGQVAVFDGSAWSCADPSSFSSGGLSEVRRYGVNSSCKWSDYSSAGWSFGELFPEAVANGEDLSKCIMTNQDQATFRFYSSSDCSGSQWGQYNLGIGNVGMATNWSDGAAGTGGMISGIAASARAFSGRVLVCFH